MFNKTPFICIYINQPFFNIYSTETVCEIKISLVNYAIGKLFILFKLSTKYNITSNYNNS